MDEQKNNIGVNNNNETNPLPQMGTVQDKYGLPPMSNFTNFDDNNTKINVDDNNTSVFDLMDQFEAVNTSSNMPKMESVPASQTNQEIPKMAIESEIPKPQVVNNGTVLKSSDNANSVSNMFNLGGKLNTIETSNSNNSNTASSDRVTLSLFSGVNSESVTNNNEPILKQNVQKNNTVPINNPNTTNNVNEQAPIQDLNKPLNVNDMNSAPVFNSIFNNVVNQPEVNNSSANLNNQNNLVNDNVVPSKQNDTQLNNSKTIETINNSINSNLNSTFNNTTNVEPNGFANISLFQSNNEINNKQNVKEIPATEVESFNFDNSNINNTNTDVNNSQVNSEVLSTNLVDTNIPTNNMNNSNTNEKIVNEPNKTKEKKSKKKSKKLLFIVLLFITLLLAASAGVLGYLMFFKTDKLVCGMQDYTNEHFFLDESIKIKFKGNCMESAVLSHNITFADEFVDEKDSYLEEVKNQYQGLGYNISFVDNENGFEIDMTFTKKELENWYGIDLKNSSKNKLKKELRDSGYTCK